ncbi:MAG: DUF3592 domain-containing protein [Chitinophagales bacterium]
MNIKENKKSILSTIIFWLIILSTFGSLLVVFPIYLIWNYKKHQELHQTGITISARVLGKSTSYSSKGGDYHYITYKYSVPTHSHQVQEITIRKDVFRERYNSHNQGDSIDIIYSPSEIEFSDIVGSTYYYVDRRMFIVLLVIDGMFLFLYMGARKSARRIREEEEKQKNQNSH